MSITLTKKMLETLDHLFYLGEQDEPMPETVERKSLGEKMWMAGKYRRLIRDGKVPTPPRHFRDRHLLLRTKEDDPRNRFCWNSRHWDDAKNTKYPCSASCHACQQECPKEDWEDSPQNRDLQARWLRERAGVKKRAEKLAAKKALEQGEVWSDA